MRDAELGRAELGVELAPVCWGRYGYATEIMKCLVDFGFDDLGLTRIFGSTVSANARIARLVNACEAASVERSTPAWMAAKGWRQIEWQIDREQWLAGPSNNFSSRSRFAAWLNSGARCLRMVMFESEADLLETIAQHDELVRQCVAGQLSFLEFCEKYNNFYAYFALDGHESDEEERSLLEKHESLIETHRVIAFEILGQVCSDEEAKLESYKNAGRFGSSEALKRLANVRSGA